MPLGELDLADLVPRRIGKQSGSRSDDISSLSRLEGGVSCSLAVQKIIPILKKTYGDSMKKILHVGPEICSVVSQLLKQEDTEAWGIEPYELDDADSSCKSLVRKGIVRVADIKFPLPYRPKTFSLVIVSDALDYLSPKYLNKTVPQLARVASDGLVILSGYPGKQRAKGSELSKWGRPAKLRCSTWWIRFFIQTSLEENESAVKKFEQAVSKNPTLTSQPAKFFISNHCINHLTEQGTFFMAPTHRSTFTSSKC